MALARLNASVRLAGGARTKALSSWMPTRKAEALEGPASATTRSAAARARRAAERPCFMSRTTVAAGVGPVVRAHDSGCVTVVTLVRERPVNSGRLEPGDGSAR